MFLLTILLYSFYFININQGLPLNSNELKVSQYLNSLHELPPSNDGDEKCTICKDGLRLFQLAVESNLTLEAIFPISNKLCSYVMGAGGEYTCPGFINSYGPVILYVFTQIVIDPLIICQDLHFCNQTSHITRPLANLERVFSEVELDFTKNKINENALNKLKKYVRMLPEQNKTRPVSLGALGNPDYYRQELSSYDSTLQEGVPGRDRGVSRALRSIMVERGVGRSEKKIVEPKDGMIRFLQLADIHLDHDYNEGSPSDCGLYVCCRHWYNGTGKAGHYGDFNCDLPMPTLDLLLDTLQRMDPPPDFIVYTGDNAPHDVWNETWSSQLEATKFVVNYLSTKLPNITIYPAIGNHESWPESEYMGTLLPYKALTRNLAEYWQKWVEFPQDAVDTIAEGGYYNIKIMDKLRLISFNSDYGYSPNFYTYLNSENDHYKAQLAWMEKQLVAAEQDGDKVLMVAHIPPGDSDNHPEYGQFYLNLTRRFRNSIVGHLFGHTHKDQFQLVQDTDGVYGIVLAAPSVTTYGHINPSFRMFTMDASSKLLLRYEQYHLNVTLANELYTSGSDIQPQFELSYSTTDEYNLKDLSPDQWASLVERFESFPALLDKYNYNFHAKSVPSERTCDASCKKRVLCSVTNIISSNYEYCLGK